ncbi:Mbov_0400 family ICE element protein [Mycoplasma procyoni]|uniref:Mbov_0400 family ICE element protein n=1 Tax=Mycoplasma procyoni TaxID=568784 RepID=UPI00197C934D|nr:hypothetical protein [Mycoplasma procyoni]MBN3534662.1 hypothetical protein [Mycoplasma procyoni]
MSLKDVFNFKKWVPMTPIQDKSAYKNSLTFSVYQNQFKSRPVVIFYDEIWDCYYYFKSRSVEPERVKLENEVFIPKSGEKNALFSKDSWLNTELIYKMDRETFDKYIDDVQYLNSLPISDDEIKSIYFKIIENIKENPPRVALIEVFENEKEELYATTLYSHKDILKREEWKNSDDNYLINKEWVGKKEKKIFVNEILKNRNKENLEEVKMLERVIDEERWEFEKRAKYSKEAKAQEEKESSMKWEFKDGDLSKISNFIKEKEKIVKNIFNEKLENFENYKSKKEYIKLIKDISKNLDDDFEKDIVFSLKLVKTLIDEKTGFRDLETISLALTLEKIDWVKETIDLMYEKSLKNTSIKESFLDDKIRAISKIQQDQKLIDMYNEKFKSKEVNQENKSLKTEELAETV